MAVQDTSREALEKIRSELPQITQRVFEAILDLGPTHNNRILEYLNQKEMMTRKPRYLKRKWQINQVCGRVNDLVKIYCIVEDLGPHKGTWYREKKTYHFWRAIGDERKPAGWTPAAEKPARPTKTITQQKAHLQQIKEKAGQPILTRLARMVEFRSIGRGRRKITVPTEQGLLFV